MSGILQDMSHWPLVIVGSGNTASTDEEIQRFIQDQKAMLARGERFVELADMTHAQMMNASQRRTLADWLKEAEGPSKRLCVGVSVVITNPLLRGGMQAVFWLASLSVPMKTAANLEEAVGHCRQWLREANVPDRERAERYFAMHERRVG